MITKIVLPIAFFTFVSLIIFTIGADYGARRIKSQALKNHVGGYVVTGQQADGPTYEWRWITQTNQ